MSRNSNSNIFRKVLNRLCEIEDTWRPPVAKDGCPAVIGIQIEDCLPEKWIPATSVSCLPYKKLRKLLGLESNFESEIEGNAGEGINAVRALDGLQPLSGYSVLQIIDGCAHALKFADDQKITKKIRDRSRYFRNSHPLKKNQERMHQLSIQMAQTALAINGSVSLAGNLLSNIFCDKESAAEITELSRRNIRQFKYGCIYYQTDRLNNHVPTPEALLTFNLEWIFRHWPVSKETFPTWPPRRQARGQAISQPCHSPRRDIVANFINAVFPSQDNETYDADTLKDNLNIPQNAIFCGW